MKKVQSKDITVVVPVHVWDDGMSKMLDEAVANVQECRSNYDGTIRLMVVIPSSLAEKVEEINKDDRAEIFVNKGNTDFCSQVNAAMDGVETEYFSILEVDDKYAPRWFNMFSDYLVGNEDVSLFLPVTLQHIVGEEAWVYANEMPLAGSYSNELGFIDLDCLENSPVYNLTGGIFKKEDFVAVGKYKPSLMVAFGYELLMRLAYNKKKIMVIPKEGYLHFVGREGSLSDFYLKTLSKDDVDRCFELAKKVYIHKKDKDTATASKKKKNELK